MLCHDFAYHIAHATMKYGGMLSGPWWKVLWIKARGSRHVEYLEDFNIAVFYHYKGILYFTYYGKIWNE